jgi:transmembrane sensor
MTTVVEFPDRRVLAKEAAQWLIRLDADTPPTREEFQALGEWLQRSTAHREELESLAALWGRMNVLTELAVPLGNCSRPAARPPHGENVIRWGWAGLLAVSVAAAIALGWLLLARQPAVDGALATNGLHATAVGQQSTVTLADGSQVILNTNSQIKVDYGESYRRVHLLQGEALFTVAKNAKRPFRVYAGQGRIEALGTAFSVFIDGADISVTVAEGRVSLAAANSPRSKTAQPPVGSASAIEDASMELLGTLEAGHAATIRSPAEVSTGVTQLQAVQSIAPEQLARRLAWREGALMFSGETLEEVIKEFGRYSTVSIEIPDEAVRNMRIGGRLPVGETEAMLAALQTNFHLRVTRLAHNRVVISAADE